MASEESLYDKLLLYVHGDKEIAERLISHERTHNPQLGRKELIERALGRLERGRDDNAADLPGDPTTDAPPPKKKDS